MKPVISFDLDGTLIQRTYADAVWLQGLPRLYAQEKNISFNEAKNILFHEYDAVGDNREEWYDIQYWFNRFNLTSSWKNLLDHYRHTVQSFPEVPGLIQRLSQIYDLIIISNAKKEFIDIELEQTKLSSYFTHIYSSTSDFHKVKKVPEFYEMICTKIGVKPSEMIHVGDHEEFDYNVPTKLGIQSFYLDRTKTSTGNHIVHDLTEFEVKILQ
jgi:5'-nucleotidase